MGQDGSKKQDMSKKKFLVWCLVLLYLIMSIIYTIMGFGRTYDIHEGQSGIYKNDREQNIRVARFLLDGEFGFYAEKMKYHFITDVGRTYNYPPVSSILVTPVVYVTQKMGLDEDAIFNMSILPFVLLSGLGVLLISSIYERYAKEEVKGEGVILTAVFLFSGLLFYSVSKAGKFEGVVAFFTLLGIFCLPKNRILSGISFGLAICTKQIAIMFALPTFIVLCRGRDYKQIAAWSTSLGATVLLVLLPFILASGLDNVYFGLMRNFDLFEIQDTSAVGYTYSIISSIFGDDSGGIQRFLQFNANKIVLLFCASLSIYLAVKKDIVYSTSERYFALLAICSFLFIILGKWYTSGIYEIAPTYILILWMIFSGEFVFGVVFLLIQSFLICNWPFALFRRQLLLMLYFGIVIYIYYSAFRTEKEPAS